jgi:signal transduction histidine kinase
LLILVSIAGGYIITQRAFAPVREVTRAAEQITKDGDLSRRIELGSGSDEIAQLSGAFNRMFERLEHNMEKEKQFTADVSNELRTPLSVIISQSDFAMQDPSYAGEALGVINKEAKDMSSLLSKLLFLSRSDADTVEIEKETVDLSALLEAVAEQQEYAAGAEGISFSSDIEGGIKVSCDEAMIMNSVLNLLGNAFKYRRQEGAEISLRLSAEDLHEAGGRTAVISVTDNGPGIAPENIERIWDRFFRESPEERRKDSSGLGLAIVKAMINVNGGTVSAESVKGEGSTFTIKLPICGMDKKDGNEK